MLCQGIKVGSNRPGKNDCVSLVINAIVRLTCRHADTRLMQTPFEAKKREDKA
jgi:hypothetical protein